MKLSKHAWILWGIALAAAVAMMALIPFYRTAAWWIAAAGTVLMFGVCAWAFARAFGNAGIESKLLGWPVFKVALAALIAQLVIGFPVMALASVCPAWLAAAVEVAVFAVTAVCLTVRDAARAVVSESEAGVKDNTAAWKAIRVRINAIAVETGNPEIQKLAEEIRYADPTPTELDGEIAELLEMVNSQPNKANITKAFQLMAQRKIIAKETKQSA